MNPYFRENESSEASGGLACQAGTWGRYIGFCQGYGHIWKTYYELDLEKYSAKPITLAHDEILTNEFLRLKRGTL